MSTVIQDAIIELEARRDHLGMVIGLLREVQSPGPAPAITSSAGAIPLPDFIQRTLADNEDAAVRLPGDRPAAGRGPKVQPGIKTKLAEMKRNMETFVDGRPRRSTSAQGTPGKTSALVLAACEGLASGFTFRDLNLSGLSHGAAAYQLRTLAKKKILRELTPGRPGWAATYELTKKSPAKPAKLAKAEPRPAEPPVPTSPPSQLRGTTPVRLPHIEGEALEATLRRVIAVLPEPFSRQDVQEALPLILHQSVGLAVWGNELVALRKAKVIVIVETGIGADAPVQYERGPAWKS